MYSSAHLPLPSGSLTWGYLMNWNGGLVWMSSVVAQGGAANSSVPDPATTENSAVHQETQ